MVNNCDKCYLVKSSDTCVSIALVHGITQAQFLTWSPSVGSDSSGLWANAYVSTSITGHDLTPTDPRNGVTTPTPIQDGMVDNCKTFHYVEANQTCASIAKKYNISVSNFTKWNPAVGSGFTGLWAKAYACVGLI